MCSSESRLARSAAWRRGWSVFTRPPRISSWPVKTETSVTSRPASRIALAVPPVESSSTPSSVRPRAKSTTPVLSETEMSARRTRTGSPEGADPPSVASTSITRSLTRPTLNDARSDSGRSIELISRNFGPISD